MLTHYSTQALVVLQKLLPDLMTLVIEQEGSFNIETTSPSGWDFWLSSAEDELTVGFAEYHTHFGWHEGEPHQDAADAAAFITELSSGQLELAAWYEGQEYVGSSMRQIDEELAPPAWLQQWWRRKQRLEIRRWTN